MSGLPILEHDANQLDASQHLIINWWRLCMKFEDAFLEFAAGRGLNQLLSVGSEIVFSGKSNGQPSLINKNF